MKILYIGTYKEPSGWGEASRTDLLALSKQFDVVARPIVYSGGVNHPEIAKLESKSVDGVTQVFQYCLPTEYDMYGRMPHFGYCEIESNNLSYSKWPEYFNMIKSLFIPNTYAVEKLKSNVNVDKKYLPHAVNTEKYKLDYPKLNIREVAGTYKFLCVAEAIPRKNLDTLIEAYYTSFDPTEPVSLIIKTNKNIDKMIEGVQNKIRIYKNKAFYQKIIVISDRISEHQMMSLYKECDCLINVSMGESWCLPVVNGIGFNKTVITPYTGGPRDLVSKYKNAVTIGSSREYCYFGSEAESFQNARDYWSKPATYSIRHAMKQAIERKVLDDNNILDEFSEDKFCGRIQELLNE